MERKERKVTKIAKYDNDLLIVKWLRWTVPALIR